MCCEKDWIDLLAALLTPTVALIATYIAWQQWVTAERKRKQDLFDKRYQFFKNFWTAFSQPIIDLSESPLEKEDILDFVHEAELLFGKDIVSHIFKIPKKQKEGSLDYDWYIKPFKKYMKLE